MKIRVKARARGLLLTSFLAALAFVIGAPLSVSAAQQSVPGARIVRLSFVEGTVTVREPDSNDWAKAFVNTPIQQGFQLATAGDSFAEVEFENGSTARLGQTTEIDFTELSAASSGSKVNRMALAQGYATFEVKPEGSDLYEVKTAQGTFTARGNSKFRVDLDGNNARVEVFRGSVDAQSTFGGGTVGKNQVLEIRPGSSDAYQTTKGITQDAWDQWVNQREGRLTASTNQTPSMTAYDAQYGSLYGWNDLSYYGNWNYLPGYGYGWIPFTSAAGWMPYTFGRWCWYPGLGYTWISGEPWGWLPFHYGNWINVAGYGWAWMPGSSMGYWSPGVVNWYQGPGWIGWYPSSGSYSGNRLIACGPSQNCATAVRVKRFRSGSPIEPNSLISVNARNVHRIDEPSVQPTKRGRLPGPAVGSHLAFLNRGREDTGNHTNGYVHSSAPRTLTPRESRSYHANRTAPGVIFNQQTHRYENNPRTAPAMSNRPGMQGAQHPGRGRSNQPQANRPANQPQIHVRQIPRSSPPPTHRSAPEPGGPPGSHMGGRVGGAAPSPHTASPHR